MMWWGLAVWAFLGLRYGMQIPWDRALRTRSRRTVRQTWARSTYIVLLHSLICIEGTRWMVANHAGEWLPQCMGLVIIAFGSLLGLAGLLTLGSMYDKELAVPENAELVTEGVYAVIRHPQRLGLALEEIGIIVASGRYVLLLGMFVVVALQMVRSRVEDELLSSEFGQEFEAYKRRVPSWLPWPSRGSLMPSVLPKRRIARRF